MDYPSSYSSRFDASPPADEDEQPGEGGRGGVVEREHMFDKVVTPSDVGKLNRLVIPKQHAEKYFPLDSSSDEKGLLLNFEDRTGKAWRFRYSYWNSSQSYVMTKGWSRFVKEKKLDAGDIVSFHRCVALVEGGGGDKNTTTTRFFIDWRRRQLLPEVPLLQFSIRPPPPPSPFILRSSISTHTHQHLLHHPHPHHHPYPSAAAGVVVWDHIGGTPTYLPPMNVNVNVVRSNMLPSSVPQQYWTRTSTVNYFSSSPSSSASASAVRRHISSSSSDADHQGVQQSEEVGGGERMVFDSVPVVQGKAAGKRLRLFGVNMDCPNNNNNNSIPSRDYDYHHHHHRHHHNHNHHEDGYPSSSITTIPASSASSSSPHDRLLLLHHHDHHHQAAKHEDPLPLQQRLPVDKGKLSSSSSSSIMSLDLDM